MSNLVPRGMTKAELLDVLDDIRARVDAGDSFEGWINWTMPSDDNLHQFDVAAGYRVGNLQGQGGFRMIGTVPK